MNGGWRFGENWGKFSGICRDIWLSKCEYVLSKRKEHIITYKFGGNRS